MTGNNTTAVLALDQPYENGYVIAMIFVELTILFSTVFLSAFYMSTQICRLKGSSRGVNHLFVMSNIAGIMYGVTRTILVYHNFCNFTLLDALWLQIVKTVRVVAMSWATFWLCFFCLERYFESSVFIGSETPGCCTWKVVMFSCYIGLSMGMGVLSLMRIYGVSSAMYVVTPTEMLSTIFAVAGFIVLKRALINNYKRIRFASLSRQYELSQNIRILLRFESTYKVIVFVLFLSQFALIFSYVGVEYGSLSFQLSFTAYLVFVAILFLAETVVMIIMDTGVKIYFTPQRPTEVVNMFDENLIVENNAENNFNALQQIWREPVSKQQVKQQRPRPKSHAIRRTVSPERNAAKDNYL
ncbi:unnamed protein product [Bursaphelenchus xylophilus]|uniref:(pine wood nematode) hypothetical protein n=1 Tax=Bursaphelenchus xylophilus TaxID=6326 RepID=A0A1I7RW51_BURXY|nr:unnamed protein product [Bursaphelenchus xylophilus]CAG9095133.1 unnamed protein product [Bursaphelenchus xylophilus]